MAFLAREIIKKKRDGESLTPEEITWLIQSYTKNEIPDYQMAAWAMAVFQNGMTTLEAANLTRAMQHSGEVVDLSFIEKPKIDKHSTGGVGDKTSMILGAIVAVNDVCVPMMAGRGLGHSGGTLDKLESIPGFNTQLSIEKFKQQLRELDHCIIGQTKNICPADKKLYALRDVTATIESIPLICASIMSKKLAEGIDGIVLDVKFGSGAFMKSKAKAKELAIALQAIGEENGKKVTAMLTSMNQVLGRYVGNAVEIWECLDILKDPSSHKKYEDTVHLSLALSAEMLRLAGRAKSYDDGYEIAKTSLTSGKAYERFEKVCFAQGGDLNKLPKPYDPFDVLSTKNGYVSSIDVEAIGIAGIQVQAGRKKIDDVIDPKSGFEVLVKVGDKVEVGQPIAKIFAKDKAATEIASDLLRHAFHMSPDTISTDALIAETIVSTRG
ncbi:MAG: thymidine phosphorylase [Bdellovibrionales bacterium]|nr:thymidine phosphorylase [Bdellovibrionales bacterium]